MLAGKFEKERAWKENRNCACTHNMELWCATPYVDEKQERNRENLPKMMHHKAQLTTHREYGGTRDVNAVVEAHRPWKYKHGQWIAICKFPFRNEALQRPTEAIPHGICPLGHQRMRYLSPGMSQCNQGRCLNNQDHWRWFLDDSDKGGATNWSWLLCFHRHKGRIAQLEVTFLDLETTSRLVE